MWNREFCLVYHCLWIFLCCRVNCCSCDLCHNYDRQPKSFFPLGSGVNYSRTKKVTTKCRFHLSTVVNQAISWTVHHKLLLKETFNCWSALAHFYAIFECRHVDLFWFCCEKSSCETNMGFLTTLIKIYLTFCDLLVLIFSSCYLTGWIRPWMYRVLSVLSEALHDVVAEGSRLQRYHSR